MYNAVAVVLKAAHAEKAYVKRLQVLCHVVECSVNARLRVLMYNKPEVKGFDVK